MNAISLLCEIIAQSGKVAAVAYRDDARYGPLLDAGLIQRDGVVQSVLCENCDAPHDADIVFEAGSYGHYCPELGFVSVERADIVAMTADLDALSAQLNTALGCDPSSGSQLGEHTWRIGLVETPSERAVVYFHPCLQSIGDLDALESALCSEIRRDFTLVLTAVGRLQYRSATTCNLAQVAHLRAGLNRLTSLVNVAEVVGAPQRRSGGRPNRHGERLQALLAERVSLGLHEEGRNDEAKAVLAFYAQRHPNDPPPKLPTVKAYVSKFRHG